MSGQVCAMTVKIQDVFLNEARRKRIPLTVYLMNGVPVKGRIFAFDNFTILMDSDGRQNLIYKHAVSTIIPGKELTDCEKVLSELADESD